MKPSELLYFFSSLITNPYTDNDIRRQACQMYPKITLRLARESSTEIASSIKQIADDFQKFLVFVEDSSEAKTLRILTISMAVGDTLSNLGRASSQQRQSRCALLTSCADFANAATPISKISSSMIDFLALLDQALKIAATQNEDTDIRKAAIILFNTIERISTASFGQTICRTDYTERFLDIMVSSDDVSLHRCALKVGIGKPVLG